MGTGIDKKIGIWSAFAHLTVQKERNFRIFLRFSPDLAAGGPPRELCHLLILKYILCACCVTPWGIILYISEEFMVHLSVQLIVKLQLFQV